MYSLDSPFIKTVVDWNSRGTWKQFLMKLMFLVQIAQACKPVVVKLGFWDSVKSFARGYEFMMGLVLFTPVAVFSWFPFVSEFQTRLLFNQAFSRGLQISRILAGRKKLWARAAYCQGLGSKMMLFLRGIYRYRTEKHRLIFSCRLIFWKAPPQSKYTNICNFGLV